MSQSPVRQLSEDRIGNKFVTVVEMVDGATAENALQVNATGAALVKVTDTVVIENAPETILNVHVENTGLAAVVEQPLHVRVDNTGASSVYIQNTDDTALFVRTQPSQPLNVDLGTSINVTVSGANVTVESDPQNPLVMQLYTPPPNYIDGKAAITGTAGSTVIESQGSGYSIFVTSLTMSNASQTGVVSEILTGTSVRLQAFLSSGGNLAHSMPLPIKAGDNAPLRARPANPVQKLYVSAQGYVAPTIWKYGQPAIGDTPYYIGYAWNKWNYDPPRTGSMAVDVPEFTREGDTILAIECIKSSWYPGYQNPTGFNELFVVVKPNTHFYFRVLAKVAGKDEPSSYRWRWDYCGWVLVHHVTFRGVNLTQPIHEYDYRFYENEEYVSAPGITTKIGKTRILAVAVSWGYPTTVPVTYTPAPGYEELFDNAHLAPNNACLSIAVCQTAARGVGYIATAAMLQSYVSSSTQYGVHIALKPAWL